jgi:hypothetical protein
MLYYELIKRFAYDYEKTAKGIEHCSKAANLCGVAAYHQDDSVNVHDESANYSLRLLSL